MKIFSMDSCLEFGEAVSNALKVPLSQKNEKFFEDKESYVASLENVRGADCFVIQSCYSDTKESVNDKLMKLFTFIGSLRDASAGRITAVIPYMSHARQDRKTASRAPITTKYIAKLFESVGTNRLLTIDVHNPTAIQNAFNINVDLLEAGELFAKHLAKELKSGRLGIKWLKNSLVVMSDVGGMTRVKKFRKILTKYLGEEVDIACVDKLHTNDGDITAERIVGNVKGRYIIVLDDMISSGKTIYECAEASRKAGAYGILAVCATHGLFVGHANKYLDHPFINQYVITNTIEPFRLTNINIKEKLVCLDTTDLFAEAILRINGNQSISDLIENGFSRLSEE